MTFSLPSNVQSLQNDKYISILDQLRERSLKPSEVRSLVQQLSSIIAKSIQTNASEDETIAIIVVLRSGLAMFDGFADSLPSTTSTATYHMGIFRDEASLQPVEYYNKLPQKPACIKQAYVLDPLIATGGTAGAVISILREWGIDRITFLSILSTPLGLKHAAGVWPESTQFVVGAIDPEVDEKGFITPGVGDIGDRLFGTIFK